MRPALLSLAVILMCVWSGNEARGLPTPRNHGDHAEPRRNHLQPKQADQKCVGRCAVEGSMGSSFYSSASYSSGDSSMGSSYYGSMVYDYDSSLGSSYYSSGSYSSGDSSMGSSYYSSGSYSPGDSSMGSSYYSSGSYSSGDSSMGSSYYGSMDYDYDSSFGSSYYGSGSYSNSYGGSMGPSCYGSGSYSYSYDDSIVPSYYDSGSYSYSYGYSYGGSGSYGYSYSDSMGSSSYGSSGSGITETTEQPATTMPSAESCTCGVRNVVTKIVGGEVATVHEFPWQVGVVTKTESRPFCGASIIANQWILTAAHCVDENTASQARVVIGEHNWATTADTQATKKLVIEEVIVHEGYDDQTMDNDIALLKLETPIVFSNKIAPICLPSPGSLFESVFATVSGWGTLSSGGSQPTTLHQVRVKTMTNEQCKNTDYSDDSITNNMICAGTPNGGKDSCQGDSGGPLVTDDADSSQLIGVVSWGIGCANKDYPGVYTRVTNYLSWISEKTANNWSTCQPIS
ncbi:hypothetical protein O3P69_016961 [Scylla paramamosain]|uniref:Peptidase S1 domain-containing protein n=1 Tax=Scylla paramamosain TaxID=85552 RepID=A0AAW0TT53_SCYPA